MKKKSKDEWLQELAARQKNTVFPGTVQNETEMWRRLAERPTTLLQQIGFIFFGIFVFGTGFFILASVTQGNKDLHGRILTALRFWAPVAIMTVLIFGPLMALLAWATKRALRNSRR